MKAAIILSSLVAGLCMVSGRNQPPHSMFDLPAQKELVLDSSVLVVTTVASRLDVPWEICWGPGNNIWFTEQRGTVTRLDPVTGKRKVLLTLPDVFRKKSYGLLGMAMHPDFHAQPFVYLDYTYLKDSSIRSKLVRYTYHSDTLTDPLVLLQDIPGNTYHNGCRIIISPDHKLVMSTGDAGMMKEAQNTGALNGKILRLNLDGSIPGDNPIAGNPVWSFGHRNPEGLVFGRSGILYSSEHGDASDDEVNIIEKGRNYGWPDVEGYCDRADEKNFCISNKVKEPLRAWTPTIAPAGIEYYGSGAIPEFRNCLVLTTLKEATMHVLKLSGDGRNIIADQRFFINEFGRLRDVCISPDGDVYISTSNRDWNPGTGFPKPEDDRIIRLHKTRTLPLAQRARPAISTLSTPVQESKSGAKIYSVYCASCHKADGNGQRGLFPPLVNAEIVKGDRLRLVKLVLGGASGPLVVKGQTYNQPMPSFKFLGDNDIAAVLNYVKTHFNKTKGNLDAALVKSARSKNH